MLLKVDVGSGCNVDAVAKGVFAPVEFGSGLLVQPHLHAITRFPCDMVSCETLEAGVVRKALFEKSMFDIVSEVENGC
jgi:hypothetical protein